MFPGGNIKVAELHHSRSLITQIASRIGLYGPIRAYFGFLSDMARLLLMAV
jgi:hypothetical protein